jgi:hypothetical protein
VLAYHPKSKYASQFKAIASGARPIQDLFPLLEKPGFKLGRTGPSLDPPGPAFIFAVVLLVVALPLPLAAYIWSARAQRRRQG